MSAKRYYCPICEEPYSHYCGKQIPKVCSVCAAGAPNIKTGYDREPYRPQTVKELIPDERP